MAELRQRKTNNKKKKNNNAGKKDEKPNDKHSNSNSNSNNNDNDDNNGDEKEETLSDTFWSHPLIRVAPFVIFPYLIYNFVYFILLKRPDIITTATFGLIPLRPALDITQDRQVLVVGSTSTDNRLVLNGMVQDFKLELVQEAFNAQDYFCRDGTISWFSIIRFLQPFENDDNSAQGQEFEPEIKLNAWTNLCFNRTNYHNFAFHPKYLRPSKCSTRQLWSECWLRECLSVVQDEWGCAWKNKVQKENIQDENNSEFGDESTATATSTESSSCTPSFERVLHQVRHPLQSISGLNATVCQAKDDNDRIGFLSFASAFFPNRPWDTMSCFEAMSWYTIDYHSTLLLARHAGLVHDMFQIEQTSPCELASRGGFINPQTSLYEPNPEKINKFCQATNEEEEESETESSLSKEKSRARNPSTFINSDKLTYKELTWDDFVVGIHGIQDSSLQGELKNLVQKLGYDMTTTLNGSGGSEFV